MPAAAKTQAAAAAIAASDDGEPSAEGRWQAAASEIETAAESARNHWRTCLDIKAGCAEKVSDDEAEQVSRLVDHTRESAVLAQGALGRVDLESSDEDIRSAVAQAQGAAAEARLNRDALAHLTGSQYLAAAKDAKANGTLDAFNEPVRRGHLEDAETHVRKASWETMIPYYRGKSMPAVKKVAEAAVAADIGNFLPPEKINEIAYETRSNMKRGNVSDRERSMLRNAISRGCADVRTSEEQASASERAVRAKERLEQRAREELEKIKRDGISDVPKHKIESQIYGVIGKAEQHLVTYEEVWEINHRVVDELLA